MSFHATSGAITQFRRLVRLAARFFYDGECPPEDPQPEDAAQPKRRRAQGDVKGLAVVLLDALVVQEWIQEDKLANALKIHPKQIRKVLKYLEDERLLAREHHKLKPKREKGEDGEEKEVVESPANNRNQQNNLISYVSIDYPMFMDALQLKLAIMKRKLKTLTGQKNQIQKYKCEGCQSEYTAFDAMALYNTDRHEFVCYKCNFRVVDSVDGENLSYQTDEQRRQSLRSMPQRFERQLKDLLELVARLKGTTPPDNGTLTDWAEKKREEVMTKGDKGQKSGSGEGGKAAANNMPEPQVKVSFNNNVPNKDKKEAKSSDKKDTPSIQPPWMVKLRQKQLEEEAKLSIKGKSKLEENETVEMKGMEISNQVGNSATPTEEDDELFKQLQQTLQQGTMNIVKTPVEEEEQDAENDKDTAHRDKRIKLEGGEAAKLNVGQEEESEDDLDWEEAA